MKSIEPLVERGASWRRVAPGIALIALCLPVLLYRLGDAEVGGVLEARVAITAREMARSGDWVLPTLNGLPRLQKPPLAYWVVMATSALRGEVDELALRLPMALLGIGTVLIAWRAGALAAGSRTGWLGAAVLLTAPLFVGEFRTASSDAPLGFCAAGAWLASLEARLAGVASARRRAARALFYTCLGLGVLAKGPVILALVPLPLLLEAAAVRRLEPLRAIWSPAGLVWFLALGLAWPLLVTARVGPAAAHQWLLESFGKIVPSDGVEGGYQYQRHPQGVTYYLLRLPAYFLLWIWALLLGLLVGARAVREARRGDGGAAAKLRAAAFVAFAGIFVFFSIVEEKKGPYALPAMLPGALLAALGMCASWPQVRVAGAWLAGILAGALGAVAATLWIEPELLALDLLAPGARGVLGRPALLGALSAFLAAGCFVAWRCLRRPGGEAAGFAWLAACLAAGFPAYHDARLAGPRDEVSMKTVAAQAAPHLPPDRRIAVAGQLPLDFLYYLDAQVRFVHRQVDDSVRLDPEQLPALAPGEPLFVSESVLLPFLDPAAPRRLQGALSTYRIVAAFNPAEERARDRFYLLRAP